MFPIPCWGKQPVVSTVNVPYRFDSVKIAHSNAVLDLPPSHQTMLFQALIVALSHNIVDKMAPHTSHKSFTVSKRRSRLQWLSHLCAELQYSSGRL